MVKNKPIKAPIDPVIIPAIAEPLFWLFVPFIPITTAITPGIRPIAAILHKRENIPSIREVVALPLSSESPGELKFCA